MAIDVLPSGSFRATVHILKKGLKRKRISKSFRTRTEAKKWEKDQSYLNSKGLVNRGPSENSTFFSIANAYLKEEIYHKSPNTVLNYKKHLERHIYKRIGEYPISKIGPKTIQRIQFEMVEDGVSSNQINYSLSIISSIFQQCINGVNQLDLKDPVKAVRVLKSQRRVRRRKYLNDIELESLLNTIKGDHYEDFILFQLNHGLRISEATAITAEKYNFKEGKLVIDQQFHPYTAMPGEPEVKYALTFGHLKNGQPREIYLNDTTKKVIERAIDQTRGLNFIFQLSPDEKMNAKKVVLKRGRSPKIIEERILDPRTCGFNRIVFKRLLRAAEVNDEFSVHNLRDTYATHFYKMHRDLHTLQKLMGHRSIKSTQIYADIVDEIIKDYANLFEIQSVSKKTGTHEGDLVKFEKRDKLS